MAITKEQALSELARRELARRSSAKSEITMKQNNGGVWEALKTFGNDANAAADSFANSYSFGGLDIADDLAKRIVPLPKEIEERESGLLNRPKAITLPGKVAEVTSGIMGGVKGGPGQASEVLASKVLPQLAKGRGALPFIVRRAKDAVSGLTAGFLYPGDLETRKKSATLGGVISPIIGAGQEAAKPLAGRLMNSVLKPGYKSITGGRNLGEDVAELGIFGTKKGIMKKAQDIINKNESQLENILKNSKGEVDVLDIASNLDELKRGYSNIGDDASVKAIEDVQNSLLAKSPNGKISAAEAQQLKRDFYGALRESSYGTSEVPAKVAARKQAARGLKVGIEKAEPNQPIGKINQEMAVAGKASDAIEKRIAQDQRNNMGGITDVLLGAGGMASGMTVPAGGLILARHALGSAPVKSSMAVALAKLASKKGLGTALSIGAAEMARRAKSNR